MGHGVGGHNEEASRFKIPDYRIYKVTKEKTPELYYYQERLAQEGLKDPWIRNLVWAGTRDPLPFYRKHSPAFMGFFIGMSLFAGFVYIDKNYHCQWHHPKTEKYPLLYQMSEEEREKRLNP